MQAVEAVHAAEADVGTLVEQMDELGAFAFAFVTRSFYLPSKSNHRCFFHCSEPDGPAGTDAVAGGALEQQQYVMRSFVE